MRMPLSVSPNRITVVGLARITDNSGISSSIYGLAKKGDERPPTLQCMEYRHFSFTASVGTTRAKLSEENPKYRTLAMYRSSYGTFYLILGLYRLASCVISGWWSVTAVWRLECYARTLEK